MTTDTRIPVPTFETTLAALLEVVAESPEQTSRHAYLDSAGYPFDLVGHVLNRLDAPINSAASGTYEFNGTKLYNAARIPTLWNRLFHGTMPDPSSWEAEGLVPTTYDYPHVMFHGLTRDADVADAFLVYVLLGKVQHFNDQANYTWAQAARRGLMAFRNWATHEYSGFLVQTRGRHEDVLTMVMTLTENAISDLTKKKAPNNG